MMFPCRIPLCLLLSVQGFHPDDPSVWVKGVRLLFSRGRTKFLLNFLPLLAISQEVVATTIVALHFPSSSPLGLLSTRARAALALLWLLSHDLDHLDGPPRRAPLNLRHISLFLIFKLFGSFSRRLGPVSTTINLQTLGHGDGSLQISLHVGPNMLLQVRLQSRKEGMEGLLISHSRKPILQLLEFLDVACDSAGLPQCS